ncbi:MAG: winged helix-turn-helix transcriptional regulator [Candidatus Omnitrophica bacterium]|nr:winged helix-turn-helix transcriptional regulator [Candidatus Omnitrophota bacterium]
MPSDIKNAARLFKALSDPTRLRILSLLQTDTLCVMDIVTILGLPQPTISRHLAYLQKTNLIKGEKKGLWHFYTSNQQSIISPPLQTVLKENFRSLKQDRKKSEALHRKGGCCPKTSDKR